ELIDLSDIDYSVVPTDLFVLVADGVNWKSRLLTEADIDDLQAYALATHNHNGVYQPDSTELDALAALTTTPFGRALLEDANAFATRTAIGAQETTTELDSLDDVSGATAGDILTVNSGLTGYDLGPPATTFDEAAFGVFQTGDATASIDFDLTAISTATTITITVPDTDVDLGDMPVSATQQTEIDTKADTAHSHANGEIADAHDHDSSATWAQGEIVLEQSASPTPTVEGEIHWDTDNNQIKVGDGAATQAFSNDVDIAAAYQATSTELDDLTDVSAVTVGHVPTVNATQDGYDFQANVRGPLVVGSANADYITDGTADDVQIQAAIDAADTAGGGVVFIQSGTYDITAPIEMKDYVTLEGEGINATDLVLANSVDNHLITSDSGTAGNVWFCTIRNMTLDGNKANNVDGDVVNMLRSHTWVVEHLQIQNASRHGVHMVGTSDPVFCINSIVKHCYISDSDDRGLKIGGYAPNNHALNNIIGTNTVSVPLVSLENTECTFIGNHVHHGAADGIEISSDRNLVIGNFVETSGANGISLTSAGSGTRVEGNSITNSGFGGGVGTFSAIKIAGDRASVIGNLCIDTQGTKTQDYGIEVTSTATYNIVRSNHTLATDQLTGDILIDGGATNNVVEVIDGDDIALTGTIDGNDISDMPVSATQQTALDGKQDTSTELDDLTDVSAVTVGHVPTVNATQDGYDFVAQSAGGDEFADDVFRIQDDGDATKEIAFQASGITTGTTRTITMPNADVDLGALAPSAHSHANGEIADAHDHDSSATWAQGQIILEQSA
ncbi:MAG: hypothetical protein E4G91_10350, partial [Candidatus Zixiibacteriota bacterium]